MVTEWQFIAGKSLRPSPNKELKNITPGSVWLLTEDVVFLWGKDVFSGMNFPD
jgi:hypothetical protein